MEYAEGCSYIYPGARHIVSARQQWMTDEILRLMDNRRREKARGGDRYEELNRRVRTECRKTTERWLTEKCFEIYHTQVKHDLFNLPKKIKELFEIEFLIFFSENTQRKQQEGVLRDANNSILVGAKEKRERWEEYVKDLFNDVRPEKPSKGDAF